MTSVNIAVQESETQSLKWYIAKWRRSKTGVLGSLIVIVVLVLATLGPLAAPFDPARPDPSVILMPPAWHAGADPRFLFGTDNLGRDILSRLIYGSQVSLLVGLCSVIVAGAIGLVVGLAAGFYGGIVDMIFMRVVDSFLAIPSILFSLVVLAVVGPGLVTLILVIGVTNWVVYARLVRGEVLSVKEREYVKAARSIGVADLVIIWRHILPNVISSFIVVSTLTIATTIIVEASLSFLGLGIQPPSVSWGGMLSDGRNYLATNWWLATFPGLAITITVLGIIFLGDWLRDVLDPRA